MFEVNDRLVYTPGGVEVTVEEVHERHLIVRDTETTWAFPVYEVEYELYEKVAANCEIGL